MLVLQGLKLSTEQKAAELQKVTVELSKSIREGSVVNFVDLLEKYESTVSWPVDELSKHEALKEVCMELCKAQSKQQSLVELGQLIVGEICARVHKWLPAKPQQVRDHTKWSRNLDGLEEHAAKRRNGRRQSCTSCQSCWTAPRSDEQATAFVCIYVREMARKGEVSFEVGPGRCSV